MFDWTRIEPIESTLERHRPGTVGPSLEWQSTEPVRIRSHNTSDSFELNEFVLVAINNDGYVRFGQIDKKVTMPERGTIPEYGVILQCGLQLTVPAYKISKIKRPNS